MRGGQKHKGIAQKQDISEDHGKSAGIAQKQARMTLCTFQVLLIPDSLTGRTSKTEFVCKSYGQLKFADKNFPKQCDRGGVDGSAPTFPHFLTEN
jgi:hypothetical protein